MLTPLGDRRVAAVSAARRRSASTSRCGWTPGARRDRARLAIVQVPPGSAAARAGGRRRGSAFVLLEEIIRAHLPQLFPGQAILESAVIRLARDAELELDDEGGRTASGAGRARAAPAAAQRRRPARRSKRGASEELVRAAARSSSISTPTTSTPCPGPLDLRVLMGLTSCPGSRRCAIRRCSRSTCWPTRQHPTCSRCSTSATCCCTIRTTPTIRWSRCSRRRPTIPTSWRSSRRSIARASARRSSPACSARPSANKQVTVLVELTARFDEERNIRWARALEEAGAHVIYGVRGYKTHAKICLIVRRTPGGPAPLRAPRHRQLQRADRAHLHRLRADDRRRTAIAEDATAFFSALTGYSDPPRLKKLVMAPTDLRRRFVQLIDRERRRAEAGQPAEIVAKMNSLIDEEIIDALYAASQAGVQIRLNVRGICALRPGRAGRQREHRGRSRSSTASSSTRASTTSSTAATRRSISRAPTG